MIGKLIRLVLAPLGALVLSAGVAAAKVTIAVGGAGCLCYLPTVLAEQLGEVKKAGVEVELINFKGGSQALTAVIGGSADVVSGYFDHCVNLAAKNQALEAFVVSQRSPGFAPGASTNKSGGWVGSGLEATGVAAMEQGSVDAAIMLDPAITLLQGKNKDLKILSDTRTQHDTMEVFGGEYPGGALYTRSDWIAKHEKETQALTNAIVATLKWLHSHTPEEIMAKMPEDMVGGDKALYLAALKNTIPMFSTTGRMDPKGAQAVLAVFSQSSPDVAKANIDLSKTYTNKFVDRANEKLGMK